MPHFTTTEMPMKKNRSYSRPCAIKRKPRSAFKRRRPIKGLKLQPIVPTDRAFAQVEAEYSDRSPAERWRLAQAQTLIDMFIAPKRRLTGKGVALNTGGRKRHLELAGTLSKKSRGRSNRSQVAKGADHGL